MLRHEPPICGVIAPRRHVSPRHFSLHLDHHSDWSRVTLHQLLAHTAGLPANFSLQTQFVRPGKRDALHAARRDALAAVLASPPESEPGTSMTYSNVGYTLAGFLAAEAPETTWEDLIEPSQYSTPIIWQNRLRAELIAGGQVYRSYDPATGALLWELDMEKGRSSATPLPAGDRLYVGTELRNRGGSDDGGGFLFAVRPGGAGDISPHAGIDPDGAVVWRTARSGIQMASPVLCAGHLYLLDRRSGILNCVNADDGSVAYRTRIPGARAFWASPWTDGEFVFCLDDNGTTHVLSGGPEFRVVRRNPLNEQTWSTPAIANGCLLIRTLSSLYCIGTDGR